MLDRLDAKHDGRFALYVAGFLFRAEGTEVALVQKQTPEWQKGKLNGIGGKVELGETPAQAMHREFLEETGADVEDWRVFCVLKDADNAWGVVMYASHQPAEIQTMEAEEAGWWKVADIPSLNCIPNLRWLVPLAKDHDGVVATVIYPELS